MEDVKGLQNIQIIDYKLVETEKSDSCRHDNVAIVLKLLIQAFLYLKSSKPSARDFIKKAILLLDNVEPESFNYRGVHNVLLATRKENKGIPHSLVLHHGYHMVDATLVPNAHPYADCCIFAGAIAVELTEFDVAIKFFTRALKVCKKETLSDHSNSVLIAIIKNSTGCAQAMRGRCADAHAQFDEAEHELEGVTDFAARKMRHLLCAKETVLDSIAANRACLQVKEEQYSKAISTFEDLFRKYSALCKGYTKHDDRYLKRRKMSNALCDYRDEEGSSDKDETPNPSSVLVEGRAGIGKTTSLFSKNVKCDHATESRAAENKPIDEDITQTEQCLLLVTINMNCVNVYFAIKNWEKCEEAIMNTLVSVNVLDIEIQSTVSQFLKLRLSRVLVMLERNEEAQEIQEHEVITVKKMQNMLQMSYLDLFVVVSIEESSRILCYRGEWGETRSLLDVAHVACSDKLGVHHPSTLSLQLVAAEIFRGRDNNKARTALEVVEEQVLHRYTDEHPLLLSCYVMRSRLDGADTDTYASKAADLREKYNRPDLIRDLCEEETRRNIFEVALQNPSYFLNLVAVFDTSFSKRDCLLFFAAYHNSDTHPEVVLMATVKATLKMIMDSNLTKTEAAELFPVQLEAVRTSMSYQLSTRQNLFAVNQTCVLAATCLLVNVALRQQNEDQIFEVCNFLEDLLSLDNGNERYVDISGLPINYVQRHVLSVRQHDVIVCVMVENGVIPEDVNQQDASANETPLCRKFAYDNVAEYNGQKRCFIFSKTEDIVDVADLRKLVETYCVLFEVMLTATLSQRPDEDMSSLAMSSLQVIDVLPYLSTTSLCVLFQNTLLLPLCAIHDCVLLQHATVQQTLEPHIVISKYNFANDWEAATYYMLLVHHLGKLEEVTVEKKDSSQSSFLILNPQRSSLQIHNCNNTISVALCVVGSIDVSGISSDIITMIGHVMETCSRGAQITWLPNATEVWTEVGCPEYLRMLSEWEAVSKEENTKTLKLECQQLQVEKEELQSQMRTIKQHRDESMTDQQIKHLLSLISQDQGYHSTSGADVWSAAPSDSACGAASWVPAGEVLFGDEYTQTNSLSLEYHHEVNNGHASVSTQSDVQKGDGAGAELSRERLLEYGFMLFEQEEARRNLMKAQVSLELERKRNRDRHNITDASNTSHSSHMANSQENSQSGTIEGKLVSSNDNEFVDEQEQRGATSHANNPVEKLAVKPDSQDCPGVRDAPSIEGIRANNLAEKPTVNSGDQDCSDTEDAPCIEFVRRQRVRVLAHKDEMDSSTGSLSPLATGDKLATDGKETKKMIPPWPSLPPLTLRQTEARRKSNNGSGSSEKEHKDTKGFTDESTVAMTHKDAKGFNDENTVTRMHKDAKSFNGESAVTWPTLPLSKMHEPDMLLTNGSVTDTSAKESPVDQEEIYSTTKSVIEDSQFIEEIPKYAENIHDGDTTASESSSPLMSSFGHHLYTVNIARNAGSTVRVQHSLEVEQSKDEFDCVNSGELNCKQSERFSELVEDESVVVDGRSALKDAEYEKEECLSVEVDVEAFKENDGDDGSGRGSALGMQHSSMEMEPFKDSDKEFDCVGGGELNRKQSERFSELVEDESVVVDGRLVLNVAQYEKEECLSVEVDVRAFKENDDGSGRGSAIGVQHSSMEIEPFKDSEEFDCVDGGELNRKPYEDESVVVNGRLVLNVAECEKEELNIGAFKGNDGDDGRGREQSISTSSPDPLISLGGDKPQFAMKQERSEDPYVLNSEESLDQSEEKAFSLNESRVVPSNALYQMEITDDMLGYDQPDGAQVPTSLSLESNMAFVTGNMDGANLMTTIPEESSTNNPPYLGYYLLSYELGGQPGASHQRVYQQQGARPKMRTNTEVIPPDVHENHGEAGLSSSFLARHSRDASVLSSKYTFPGQEPSVKDIDTSRLLRNQLFCSLPLVSATRSFDLSPREPNPQGVLPQSEKIPEDPLKLGYVPDASTSQGQGTGAGTKRTFEPTQSFPPMTSLPHYRPDASVSSVLRPYSLSIPASSRTPAVPLIASVQNNIVDASENLNQGSTHTKSSKDPFENKASGSSATEIGNAQFGSQRNDASTLVSLPILPVQSDFPKKMSRVMTSSVHGLSVVSDGGTEQDEHWILPRSPSPRGSHFTLDGINENRRHSASAARTRFDQEPVVCLTTATEGARSADRNDLTSRQIPSIEDPLLGANDVSLRALEDTIASVCATMESFAKERETIQRLAKEREEREREARTRRVRERIQREVDKRRHERELRERAAMQVARDQEERATREREERERRVEYREQQQREQAEREREGSQANLPQASQPVTERRPVQESSVEWPCEHYKRKCYVQFPCCKVFYPCHRCHNRSKNCENTSNKALHATHIRCLVCLHEQEITEDSESCANCHTKLSEYFCGKCKHFTGVEKTPYHCDPCGICRIHKERSFHCDVCNVCLDQRLKNKHKCRADSGHDECCICLEDAFSGCQILPCSHKLHRECAIAMVRNGIRTCPVCRHPLNEPMPNDNGTSNE